MNDGVWDLITLYLIVRYTEIINIKKSDLPVLWPLFQCFSKGLLESALTF